VERSIDGNGFLFVYVNRVWAYRHLFRGLIDLELLANE
jgi:hypothetical protein